MEGKTIRFKYFLSIFAKKRQFEWQVNIFIYYIKISLFLCYFVLYNSFVCAIIFPNTRGNDKNQRMDC